jgi:uncharacterized protein (DUF2141 family)
MKFLFLYFILVSQTIHAQDLTITLSNLNKNRGGVNVLLFNDAINFNKTVTKNAYAYFVFNPSLENHSISLSDLPKGEYAIVVHQDENNNGKLDVNLLGIPTEGYGYTNAVGKTKEAKFIDAKFKHSKSGVTTVDIKLIRN